MKSGRGRRGGRGSLSGQRAGLLPARHARVAEQSAAKDDAVGDEAGERACALASAGDDEREDERGVKKEGGADSEERPRQEVHPHEASRPRAKDKRATE